MKEFTPIFRGTVEEGCLKAHDPVNFKRHLSSMRGEVEIIVRKWKSARVIKQNSLYWAYLRMVEDETGSPSAYLHEYFKRELLPPKEIILFGKKANVPHSTTDLSTVEFANYLKRIEAETGFPIPDTNKTDVNE